jgi:hypothetical protein
VVLAVQNGRIIRGTYPLVTYCVHTKHETTTYAIDVAHEDFTIRYGEIPNKLPDGLKAGSTVTEGQMIACVGVQCGNSMLHVELFRNPNCKDYLTDASEHRYLYVPQAN